MLAYKSRDEFEKEFINCYPIYYSSSCDAQCFTTIYNKSLYIVFRGTESIRDWITDANMVRVPMDLPSVEDKKRPKVHWGFLRQFRSLEEQINDDIEYYIKLVKDPADLNIIITGHSLGGALCSLAGLQYSLNYPNIPISCYTFGSPRVGNRTFVNMFIKNISRHKRFVNENDPVTMIPFSIRFRHLPGLNYFNEKCELCLKLENKRLLSMLKDLILSIFGVKENPVGDHSCDQYYEKLQNVSKLAIKIPKTAPAAS